MQDISGQINEILLSLYYDIMQSVNYPPKIRIKTTMLMFHIDENISRVRPNIQEILVMDIKFRY